MAGLFSSMDSVINFGIYMAPVILMPVILNAYGFYDKVCDHVKQ